MVTLVVHMILLGINIITFLLTRLHQSIVIASMARAKARVLQENLRPRAKTQAKAAIPLDRRARALVMEEFFRMPKEPARRKEKAKDTNLA